MEREVGDVCLYRKIVYPHRRIEKGAQENRLPTPGKTVKGRFAAAHGGRQLHCHLREVLDAPEVEHDALAAG